MQSRDSNGAFRDTCTRSWDGIGKINMHRLATILTHARLFESYRKLMQISTDPMVTDTLTSAAPNSLPGTVLRTVIADDESLARKKLRLLLDSEAEVNIVAECSDGRQTISAVKTCRPDLLLLDIQMPDLDGFQVLSEISPAE